MRPAPALIARAARRIEGGSPLIAFPRRDGGSWKGWHRYLAVRGETPFELGNICRTCQFWFRRLSPEAAPIDVESVNVRLEEGLATLDEETVSAFARLLPEGDYRIALLELVPQRVRPGGASDYFRNEQAAAWDDLQEQDVIDPGTDYYRPAGRSAVAVGERGGLSFEFLVPLQRPDGLDEARIGFFEERLAGGRTPTAVSVGMLDLKQHWDSATAHWCLAHFLLDGHHKVEAAARSGRPLTLLSFIACDAGLSSADEVDRLLASYAGDARMDFGRP